MTALAAALAAPKSEHYSDHLAAAQGTSADKGFNHVSAGWYSQTLSYDEGFAAIAADKALRVDITCGLPDMTPTVNNKGEFVMQHTDGRQFKPTPHAIAQMGTKFGTGTWYPEKLLADNGPGDGAAIAYAFHHGRAKLARELSNNAKKGGRKCHNFLFRCRQDGELRAMMTEAYNIVDNEWYLNVIKQAIPGGRLSHWRGDSDTIYGNVLIPDTMRADTDSEYGGMISLSNCEISTRSINQQPSVFRFICMNGCIHGGAEGKRFKFVHRGEIKLAALKEKIIANIESQIPLLPQGIDKLLSLRTYRTDVAVKPVVAQVAADFGISKGQASAVLMGYIDEDAISPDTRGSLFHLVNAITRAGQKFSNADWYKFDVIGGQLMEYTLDDWGRLTGRAKQLKAKQVDDAFVLAS